MKTLLYLLIPLILTSCSQDFLDVKPSSATVVPATLQDFQQLLDADFMHYTSELGDLMVDDYYLEKDYWQSMSNIVFRNAHVWADDIYETQENELYGWNIPYQQVFYANVVLEGLEKIVPTESNGASYRRIKGSAYFVRAWALHQLLQLYAPAYDEATADTDHGVPLPQKSDVNEKMFRLSNKACYSQVVDDLTQAIGLLDETVDFSRPSKSAALALMARVYLMQGDYAQAKHYSGQSLAMYGHLTDFNTESRRDYKKVMYLAMAAPAELISNFSFNAFISTDLLDEYGEGDFRRQVFFQSGGSGRLIKRDSYGLSLYCFSGLDTDEQYLIKAECEAYLDQVDDAMETLNYLLTYRYNSADFDAYTADSREEALSIVRRERRKELIFRGIRWMDLKRYNREGAGITLTRSLGERLYKLEPGSDNWLLPIPTNEITGSGILQNPRGNN